MHQSDPSQGELSFELLAEIAVGTTARIELCRVTEGRTRGELVVVKRLHPYIAEDPQFVDMFRDEVWMTAALKNPHVVEVIGWGQDARGPWLAVEFVRGVSLQRLMKTVFETGEQFTERMVVYLARSMCAGLAEAHGLRAATGEHLNLVHRDLTPGNVLLGFDGQVKITDFGLAKATQRLTKTLTGLLKGQPQYMSPEQVHGQPLDGRSDIFALGVVLFELFTGRRPWNATSDLDAMRAITDEEPADLASLRPRIDKALVEIVHRCLEKSKEQRYQSAAELCDRFQHWLDAHGYRGDNHLTLARFVRRNAMRQMRWFERAMAGEFAEEARAQQASLMVGQPILPHAGEGPLLPSREAPRATEENTRDERPSVARPPTPRSEAKTQVAIQDPLDGDDDPDSIDWGDDGPTLVKKSSATREEIQRARRKSEVEGVARASRRQRLPSAGDMTTKRRRVRKPLPRVHHDIEDEDSSEIATRVGNAATVTSSPGDVGGEDEEGADATIQLDEARERVRGKLEELDRRRALGRVAPPDPDVPPLPGGARPPGQSAPRYEPPAVTDTAATRPLASDDRERASESPAVRSRPSRPVAYTQPIGLPDAESLEVPVIGALPVPRFPSDPSFTGEVLSTDFGGEALRLSQLARSAADEARSAAALARAATHAQRLAQGAAALAHGGQQHQALVQLRAAQTLGEAVQRRELPADWEDDLEAEVPTFHSPALDLLARRLRTREGATMAALVGIGAVLVVLLVIVIVW